MAKCPTKIKTSKISLYALIVEGELVSFDNNLLTISYKEGYAFHLQAISKRDNKEFIEKSYLHILIKILGLGLL